MKPAWRGALAAASVVLGLASGGVAHAQGKQKAPDVATQNAVADYNAGNFASAHLQFAQFARAAKKGSRLAEFNYAMMLLNGEGGPADVSEGKKWLRGAAPMPACRTRNTCTARCTTTANSSTAILRKRIAGSCARRTRDTSRRNSRLPISSSTVAAPRDNTQAFVWYKKAAEGGDMTAQYVAG